MPRPHFSVLLPTHNRAGRLRQAIESVLVQDYPDWELVIIDDGSTDDTAEVARAYADADDRIHYHHQDNRQLNGARNAAVARMRGHWGCFLDDDDYFLPEHLGLLADYIYDDEDKNVAAIYRSGQLLERDGKLTRLPNFTNGSDTLRQYWQMPVGPFGMAIRVDVLRAHPFAEALLLLDDFVWLSDVLRDHRLYQLPTHSVVVRAHADQRSRTYPSAEQLAQNVATLRRAYAAPGVAERVPEVLLRQRIVHQHTHLARQLGRGGRRAAAWRQLGRALAAGRGAGLGDILRTAGVGVLGGG